MEKKKVLTPKELKRRAKNIRLVLTDVDGVLTDTGVYYSADGEMMRRFSIRDGMGVELLRDDGVETAIITREASSNVAQRSKKLKMPYMFLGIQDKKSYLKNILSETSLTMDQLGYIGDDVNDLEILQEITKTGLTAAPGDAMPSIKKVVHLQCKAFGGHGAFRDFADWILALRKG